MIGGSRILDGEGLSWGPGGRTSVTFATLHPGPTCCKRHGWHAWSPSSTGRKHGMRGRMGPRRTALGAGTPG